MRFRLWKAAALAAGLSLSLRAAPAREATPAPEAGRLYHRFCASCHGGDFKGSDWRSAAPDMPEFTSPAWHAGRSDARLLVSIRDGRGQMPSFARKLSEEQRRGLVALLRRAAPAPVQQPAAGPDDFEMHFEELMLRMEALKKEFDEADHAEGPWVAPRPME